MRTSLLLCLFACAPAAGVVIDDEVPPTESPATDAPTDAVTPDQPTDAADDTDAEPVDPWRAGPEAWSSRRVTVRAAGVDVPIEITAPTGPGPWPVVWLFHGFLLDARWYSDIAERLASHGVATVAPQLHPADGNPLGKPTVAEDAALAADLPAALRGAGEATGLDLDRVMLAGHSRGAKVAWTMVANGATPLGLLALDPVDGTGGPLGGEPRVLPERGSFPFEGPTVVIGTGLGPEAPFPLSPSCAPDGDNHAQFWAAAQSGWHLVASDYGHLDVLDASRPGCGLVCRACVDGPADGGLRAASAAWVVAFSRVALGDASAGADLSRTNLPIEVEVETRAIAP